MTNPDIQALSSEQLGQINGGTSKFAFTEDGICGTPWKKWWPGPNPGPYGPKLDLTIPVLRF